MRTNCEKQFLCNMKPNPALRSFLFTFGSAMLAVTTAQADILHWDGLTPGGDAGGGAGTWDNSTANWSTAATGGSAIDWDDSNFAVFGGTAGTVTLGAPITTSGMLFNVHSYSIDASTNALTFASGNNTISTSFTSAAGNITSLTGTVSGGSGANLHFTALNPSYWPVGSIISFNGDSAGGWGGTTTIDKFMTVRLQDANRALANTSGITLRGGMIVLTNVSSQASLNRVNDSAIINSYGGSIRTNNTSTASTNYVENFGELKLNGGLTTLIHNISNNSTGRSQLLSFSNITRASGSYGTLFAGSNSVVPNSTTHLIRNSSITTATADDKTIGPWLTLGNNAYGSPDYAKYDASGNIIAMVRSAGNILTNLQEGSLTTAWADTANFQWTGAALTANRVVNTLRHTGGTFELSSFSFAANGILGSNTNVTIHSTTGGSTGYLTAAGGVGNDNADVLYLNSATGNLFVNAPIKDNGNPVTLVATTGTGRIQLNAVNTHTGGTVISSQVYRNIDGQDANPGNTSRILLQNVNALGPNTNRLRVESGYLDLGSLSPTVGKFDGFVSGVVTGSNASTVLTVGNGTVDSDISDFAGTLNNISLTKTGAGTQILSGVNVTTGAVTVSAGTLLVNGSLGNSAVTVNAGAFGGSGMIGSTLNLTSGSFHVVDLLDALRVTGTVTLYAGFGVDDLAGLTWDSVADGTYSLIDGTLGAGVFAGLNHNSLATAYDIGGGRIAYFQEGSLQLVVIPEPRAAMLGGLGLLALLRRRRY